MSQTNKDFHKKNHFNHRETGFEDVKDTTGLKPNHTQDLDFFELYDLFKTEYEQFLTDTSDEIAKRARKLSELKSSAFGNSKSP